MWGRWAAIFGLYLLAAWGLHGSESNIWTQLLGGGDSYTAGLPSKLFATSLSAWNQNVQLGQFSFANTQFQPFYPPGLLVMGLLPNNLGYNLFLLGHYAMAGFFFYLWMRQLGRGREAAFLGGLSFLAGGFLVAHKGHQAMMTTAIWLPLLLLFAARHATGGRREAVGAGVALAFSILAGFPQVTLYGLMVVVPYWFWRSEGRAGRATAGLGLMVLLGFLLSSLQLMAVVEMLPQITRETLSLAMFSENSLPGAHWAALIVPTVLGGMHGVPSYAKDAQLVEVFLYCGLVPLVLAGLARGRDAWFWGGVFVVSAGLSLGFGPVQEVLFRVPGYNLFRAAGRHSQEMALAVSVLATMGFERLEGRRRWSFGVVGVMVAAGLGWAVVVPIYDSVNVAVTGLSAAHWREVNTAWLHPTMVFPVVAWGAAGVCLWRRAPGWVWAAVLLLDVWSVNRTIYANPNTATLYGRERKSEIRYLFEKGYDPVHERILAIDPQVGEAYPLQSMMYGLNATNDYTPMWMKRYQALTGFALNGAGGEVLVARRELVSSLGVRFVLTKVAESAAAVRGAKGYVELAASREGVTVFENPAALRRFRFVREVVPVADFAAAQRLWAQAGGFDPVQQAMVEGATKTEVLSEGRVESERIGDSLMEWRVVTEGERSLFVVADTWFPGWTATVDGRAVPIEIVNGCVRGVFVNGAGEHEVAMRFWPWSLTVGLGLTALGLVLGAGLVRSKR